MLPQTVTPSIVNFPGLSAHLTDTPNARQMLATLENLPGIHPVNPRSHDALSLRDFVQKMPEAQYGSSWMYLTQAADTRALRGEPYGYWYVGQDRMAAVGMFERPYDRAEKTMHFHLIRPMGSWTLTQIQTLCADLREISGQPVYLKKITEGQKGAWHGGRFADGASFPWHHSAPLEDDTHPEVVLTLDHTLRYLGNAAGDNELRRKFRTFEKRFPNLERVEYAPQLFSEAWKVVQGFFREHKDLSCAENYWNMLETLPAGRNREDYFAWLYRIDNRPVAVFLADKIGPGAVGVYANLTVSREDYSYLSEYLLLNEFRHLADAGIYTANLGGSETAGLHAFKCKFRPACQSQMEWLVYN